MAIIARACTARSGKAQPGRSLPASSPKVKHLAADPFLLLAYIADPFKPIYVECRAVWDGDRATRQRIWDRLRHTPPPLGFDPALTWDDIEDPENGLLR